MNLLHYLTMASEGGFDVMSEMRGDNLMGVYRKDPRVILLVKNAHALRTGRVVVEDTAGNVPTLLPIQPN